jgi:hypothetical protein
MILPEFFFSPPVLNANGADLFSPGTNEATPQEKRSSFVTTASYKSMGVNGDTVGGIVLNDFLHWGIDAIPLSVIPAKGGTICGRLESQDRKKRVPPAMFSWKSSHSTTFEKGSQGLKTRTIKGG